MVRHKFIFAFLVGCCAIVPPAPGVTAAQLSPVVAGNNQFAVDLYKQLGASASDNLLVSPLSISTALAMTYVGARGQTAAEMADVLHFELPQNQLHAEMGTLISGLNEQDRDYTLDIASRLWGQVGYPYQPDFLATTREHYGAELAEVDFVQNTEASRLAINDWVQQKTQNRIEDLIPAGALNELTRLVLTNAIYFHSSWTHEFDQDLTQSAPFHVTGDEQIEVPMMSQQRLMRYGEMPNAQVLEMPYGSVASEDVNSGAEDNVSMFVVLPTAADGLAELEASLDAESLTSTIDQQLFPTQVRIEFPRFDLTDEMGLGETLATMGMPTAFSDLADFSGISDEPLSISDVVHKTFIRVNEEGTEAAGATGVVIGTTSVVQTQTFRADHPFLFLIRDNPTGSILFMGRVTRPEVSGDGDVTTTELVPGDANQDLVFDQFDLIQVLQAGKYLTGQVATWGQGDWNGAPGGSLGNPPEGDGVFDQRDIMAALQMEAYLDRPQAALPPQLSLEGDIAAVPEPASLVLLGLGLLGLATWLRRSF